MQMGPAPTGEVRWWLMGPPTPRHFLPKSRRSSPDPSSCNLDLTYTRFLSLRFRRPSLADLVLFISRIAAPHSCLARTKICVAAAAAGHQDPNEIRLVSAQR
jgi:hypothetical protein